MGGDALMLIPSLPHMDFFHFSDICCLDFNGSIKFLESAIVFDSFLEGRSNIGSRMLCHLLFTL
jgi:hypothetical protein